MANKLLHLRTSGDTAPSIDKIDYGELAISLAASKTRIYLKNLNDEIVEFADISYFNNLLTETIKDKLGINVNNNILNLTFNNEIIDSIILPTSGGGGVDCVSIEFDTTNIEIEKDGTYQLSPSIKPINCSYPVVYNTTNPSLATVSDSGLLSWVSGGETTVEVACGSKIVTLSIKLDALIETLYSVSDVSYNSRLMANDDTIIINYNQHTTNTWSVRGDIDDVNSAEYSTDIGYNYTNNPITYASSFTWNDCSVEYNIEQSHLVLLPFKMEYGGSNSNATFSKKNGVLDGGAGYNDRRTIAQLRNDDSFTNSPTSSGLYTGIYIPANTTELEITWDSENENWYYSANIYKCNDDRTATRILDKGWNIHNGSDTIDLSDYHEGLWLYGNFAWTKTRDEVAQEHCSAMTWNSINFNINYTSETNWTTFRSVRATSKVNETTGELSSDGVSRMLQGGAYLNGSYYQFYDKNGGYYVYDMTDSSATPVWHQLNCDPQLHFGSVSFSNIYTYGTTTTTIPLIGATGHYTTANGSKKIVVDIIDIENDVLVKQYTFPDRKDDAIAAWDFENNKLWLIGYERATGYAITPWYIDEYTLENVSNTSNCNYTLVSSVYLDNTNNNTLQDCEFKDGYIYIATGWGSTKGQTVSVWKYDTVTNNMIGRSVSEIPTTQEAEGFALTEDYMIVSTNQNIHKVLYNFDATTKVVSHVLEIQPVGEVTAEDLYLLGCEKVYEVLETYPSALDSANGKQGLYFIKNNNIGGVIRTDIIPDYNENVEITFETLNTLDGTAKTLFCSRADGSGSKSFTTFIIGDKIRADYDNPSTANDAGRYVLSPSSFYKYVRKHSFGDSLNNSEMKAFKYLNGTPYTTTIPYTIGASITSINDYNNRNTSNYLNNIIVHIFATKNTDGNYTHYLVGVDDNTMADLVTGNIIVAPEKTNQNVAYETIELISTDASASVAILNID